MGYMRDLDEYTESQLVSELMARRAARAAGNCDYCHMPIGRPPWEVLQERGTQEEGNTAGASQTLIDEMRERGSESCRFSDRHAGRVEVRDSLLTFDRLSEVNEVRCQKWHEGSEPWMITDWTNAVSGEVGELVEAVLNLIAASGRAGNLAKKIRRLETNTQRHRDAEANIEELKDKVAEEGADVIIYTDLVLFFLGRQTSDSVRTKFNNTSIEFGFEERL